MLEVLSEANAFLFSHNKNYQTPRKVALQSLILYKTLRKYENKWIRRNIINDYANRDTSNDDRQIQNLKSMIEESMKKKHYFLNQNTQEFDVINQSRLSDLQAPQGNYKMKQIKNSLPFQQLIKDTSIDDILDPEITCRNKFSTICSRISDTECDINDVDEQVEQTRQKATEQVARQMVYQKPNPSNEKKDLDESDLAPEQDIFALSIQPLQNLTLQAFKDELLRIEFMVGKPDLAFTEKLKIINFFKIIHLRLTKPNVRFYSEVLPLNIYLINEFMYSKTDQQSEEQLLLIPHSFQRIINSLYSQYLSTTDLSLQQSVIYLMEQCLVSLAVMDVQNLPEIYHNTLKMLSDIVCNNLYHKQNSNFLQIIHLLSYECLLNFKAQANRQSYYKKAAQNRLQADFTTAVSEHAPHKPQLDWHKMPRPCQDAKTTAPKKTDTSQERAIQPGQRQSYNNECKRAPSGQEALKARSKSTNMLE